MASSLMRFSLYRNSKFLFQEVKGNVSSSVSKVPLGAGHILNQAANISSKKVRDEMEIVRPKPFPYKDKKFNFYHYLFDSTFDRMDENSKIIVVDGNIAAGKTSFAKKLSEELDMYYVSEPSIDLQYVTEYGYDLRQLDPLLNEATKSYDLKRYYKEPNHQNAFAFQVQMFSYRLEFYIDSLCHLLNTGQGIVMDRSVFSDIVFLETMVKFGYIRKQARRLYHEIRENTLLELMKPHLVIYLDVPAKTCLERIKRRALPHEIETDVLSLEYLQSLEHHYKNTYLPEMNIASELMVFDWSEYGDVEVVVEDIERLNFDNYDLHDPKCEIWRIDDHYKWSDYRDKYTNEKTQLMNLMDIIDPDVPELYRSGADTKLYNDALETIPKNNYAKGFNPERGDKWLLFKNKVKPRDTMI